MVLLQTEEVLDIINLDNRTHMGQLVDREELLNQLGNKKKLISVLHVNIRSVNRNMDSLLLLIRSFDLSTVDVIVLSETFQMPSIDNCNLDGYAIFYNHAKFNRNDGVIIYIKNEFNPSYSKKEFETSKATVGRITFKKNNISIGITASYKPPPISKAQFINDIQNYLRYQCFQEHRNFHWWHKHKYS